MRSIFIFTQEFSKLAIVALLFPAMATLTQNISQFVRNA
jgi:hypothetical protein